ncbi:NUDIX domain-containing protein [Microcoleus sp. ARI1-B5]|uniref:NUDIX hydrolase n=1 Tax=unclassified Microcoleus TaxID=2642155 RepID=UPI002FCF8CC6
MHTIGAFAIIDNGGKVLLCHRTDRDAWNLPGGRVEAAETPWAAVVREVEEEVGLLVKVIGAILCEGFANGIYAVPSRSDLVFTFRCEVVGGSLRTTEEADDMQWYLPSELPVNSFSNHVERIQDGCAGHSEVLLKTQD